MGEDVTSADRSTSAPMPPTVPAEAELIGFDEIPPADDATENTALREAAPSDGGLWRDWGAQIADGVRKILDIWAANRQRISTFKIVLTVSCFVAAAYLLAPTLFFTYSERAVTNAPTVTLRPPIPGTVDAIIARVGEEVSEGSAVATVNNLVWDPSPVLEIDQRLRGAQARVEASSDEIAGLTQVRDQLHQDYETWRGSMTRTADLQIEEAQQHLEAAQARVVAAQTNLERYSQLESLALVSQQRLTDIRRDYSVAIRDQLAAQSTLQQAKEQRETMGFGVTLGQNDEPPSLQRMHEVDILLATQKANLAAAQVDVKTLQGQRQEVLRQRDRETQAVLQSPVRGQVWRIFARPGEAVSSHSEVASILDCDRLGITAIFNQRHVAAILPGRRVSVRLVGITKRLWGRVAYVNGYYKSDDREAEAIALKPEDDASVMVWVTLDEPLADCWVGLKATVRLD
jgi:multidrug resistance efflux pump